MSGGLIDINASVRNTWKCLGKLEEFDDDWRVAILQWLVGGSAVCGDSEGGGLCAPGGVGVLRALFCIARDSMLSALYAIANPSVCLSVTRVDQSKTVEVRIMQFSPYSSSSLKFLQDKFHPEILTGSPERGRQTRVGNLTVVACRRFNT